jgi:predicted metal-binding protein
MCDICRQFVCPGGCPNAPEAHAVFVCSGCDRDIYEGEDVYHIMGEQFCERCIERAKEVAEFVYDEEDDQMEIDI